MRQLVFLFLSISVKISSQNFLSEYELKLILPSTDRVMVTSINEIPGTSYFLTTGDNNTKVWDLRSKKLIGELKNNDEKRTSLYLSAIYNSKAKVIVQETVNSINFYTFPGLVLIRSIPIDILNESFLFNPMWPYVLILKDKQLSKLSLIDFTYYHESKIELDNIEMAISLDSSVVYYYGPNGYLGLASFEEPSNIKWGIFDQYKDLKIEEVLNRKYYLVYEDDNSTRSNDYENIKKYFLYNTENSELIEIPNVKADIENIYFDNLNETLIYSDSYFKNDHNVSLFSIKEKELVKTISSTHHDTKNRIEQLAFDPNLGLIWILDNYQLRGYSSKDFELKYDFKNRFRSFKRIQDALIFVNADFSVSIMSELEKKTKVEYFKTNFLSQIHGVNNDDTKYLNVLTSTYFTRIDLNNLHLETKIPLSELLNLKTNEGIEFWEGNFILTDYGHLLYISEDSVKLLSYKGIYFDDKTENLYLTKDNDILRVNVNGSLEDLQLICTVSFMDSLSVNEIFQFTPNNQNIYFLRYKEPSKMNLTFNFDDNPFLGQYDLIRKSINSSEEKTFQLPNNTSELICLRNNYFLIKFENRSSSKSQRKKGKRVYERDGLYSLYKIDQSSIHEVKKFQTNSKLIGNPDDKLTASNLLFFAVEDKIQIYDIEKNEEFVFGFNKEIIQDAMFDTYKFDFKHNLLFFNNFIANNLIYDFKKKEKIVEFKAHPWQQNSIGSFNGNTFYSSNDQEIILWNNKLERLFSIYMHINGSFHIQDSSGYYSSNKTIVKDLYFTDQQLNVIGFEQIDPICNRPGLLLSKASLYFKNDESPLVKSAELAYFKRLKKLGYKDDITKFSFPIGDILDSKELALFQNNELMELELHLSDSLSNLDKFNIIVNEVPLYGSAGISIAHLKKQVWDTTVSVPLSVGENKIQVSVMNELGLENFKYPTYVNYTPEKEIVAKTYYIGIGVNEFKEAEHNLKYCVKDVRDLAKAFATQNKNVDTLLFTDQQVTKENILALKDYLNKTGVNDKVIISCSSHGLLDDSLNFYLAMHDVDFNNPKARGLKYEELESLLDGIPARQKLLLLDACNSGENDKTEILKQELQQKEKNMDSSQVLAARGVIIKLEEENKSNFKKMNELFVNVRNNTGSVIISAAGGKESALEAIEVDGKTIKNGAFTYSILECLKQNEGKELKVNTLKQYAEKRVEEITNGKQKPTSRQETMEIDWGVR